MVSIPEWAWEFHGHRCPFMPLGYRMGIIALRELGMERVKDHGAYALPEIGIGHPQTCMADGIQVATGCTYGKLLMERRNYGKIALVLYAPDKGAVRVSVKNDFLDQLGKFEFFAYRKKGIEPSEIPAEIIQPVIDFVLSAPEEAAFKIQRLDDFNFTRPRPSFARNICANCGEAVFERYLKVKDGEHLCIPCAGYEE